MTKRQAKIGETYWLNRHRPAGTPEDWGQVTLESIDESGLGRVLDPERGRYPVDLADLKSDAPPSVPTDVYRLGWLGVGDKVGGWLVIKVSSNQSQVTVQHLGGFDSKPRRYTWDGRGYKRGGNYLRKRGTT